VINWGNKSPHPAEKIEYSFRKAPFKALFSLITAVETKGYSLFRRIIIKKPPEFLKNSVTLEISFSVFFCFTLPKYGFSMRFFRVFPQNF